MSRFELVAATVKAELAKPYAYGEADCFFLGLAVVDALTGTALREEFSGRYATLLGAQRALRKAGHKGLTTFFAGQLEEIAPASAALGDLAVLRLVDGEHVAICLGDRFVTKTERGAARHGLADCIAAFKVE